MEQQVFAESVLKKFDTAILIDTPRPLWDLPAVCTTLATVSGWTTAITPNQGPLKKARVRGIFLVQRRCAAKPSSVGPGNCNYFIAVGTFVNTCIARERVCIKPHSNAAARDHAIYSTRWGQATAWLIIGKEHQQGIGQDRSSWEERRGT